MRGIREVEAGWTARGPGIWTDEEFSSSAEELKDELVKPLQKKPFDIIRKERAERAVKRTAASAEKTPFIVQKKRSALQQTPAIVKKVRDIVYSRSVLLEVRSRGSRVSLMPAAPEKIVVNVSQCESSHQLKEETKKSSKKAEAKPELLFLRAIRDVRASA
ncbi:hypothetical protein AAVH_23185 [Aphelenchoides avenae]|nr:hypothetical protein AAVH_23185 [Aphelenchus avenae]